MTKKRRIDSKAVEMKTDNSNKKQLNLECKRLFLKYALNGLFENEEKKESKKFLKYAIISRSFLSSSQQPDMYRFVLRSFKDGQSTVYIDKPICRNVPKQRHFLFASLEFVEPIVMSYSELKVFAKLLNPQSVALRFPFGLLKDGDLNEFVDFLNQFDGKFSLFVMKRSKQGIEALNWFLPFANRLEGLVSHPHGLTMFKEPLKLKNLHVMLDKECDKVGWRNILKHQIENLHVGYSIKDHGQDVYDILDLNSIGNHIHCNSLTNFILYYYELDLEKMAKLFDLIYASNPKLKFVNLSCGEENKLSWDDLDEVVSKANDRAVIFREFVEKYQNSFEDFSAHYWTNQVFTNFNKRQWLQKMRATSEFQNARFDYYWPDDQLHDFAFLDFKNDKMDAKFELCIKRHVGDDVYDMDTEEDIEYYLFNNDDVY